MANALYDPGREGILDESIHVSSGDIRIILLKTGYTFSAAHKFVSDLTPASWDNGRSTVGLSSKTFTNGVFNAASQALVATAAVACFAVALYIFNAADASARLIAFVDTETGLPFTPGAGQTVTQNWDAGANHIFKL